MITQAINKAKTPEEVTAALQKIYNLKSFKSLSHSIASKFVTLANIVNAKSWRGASLAAGKGKEIYSELHKVLETTNVGLVANKKILDNANLIKTLPLEVSKDVTAFVASKAFQGIRSSDIAKILKEKTDGYTNARATLIARTETSKAMMALNEARALDVGIEWYVWRTANDGLRVREAHRLMKGVLVQFKNPPAPEVLNGEKSQGHYNAGEIYNCRCYAEPLILLNNVSWPASIHMNGTITKITRLEFEQMNPSYSKKIQAKPVEQPKVINPTAALKILKIHQMLSK